NNFLLPVQVSEAYLQQLLQAIYQQPDMPVKVDLENQAITYGGHGQTAHFDISPYKKTCLLNGYDDIDYLLSIRQQIETYEQKRNKAF
nr:3-isopropylmalate dehydratase small subunit [Chitinophagaceae bacterium]